MAQKIVALPVFLILLGCLLAYRLYQERHMVLEQIQATRVLLDSLQDAIAAGVVQIVTISQNLGKSIYEVVGNNETIREGAETAACSLHAAEAFAAGHFPLAVALLGCGLLHLARLVLRVTRHLLPVFGKLK